MYDSSIMSQLEDRMLSAFYIHDSWIISQFRDRILESIVKYTITAESIRFLVWKYTIFLRKVYVFWLKVYDVLKYTIFQTCKEQVDPDLHLEPDRLSNDVSDEYDVSDECIRSEDWKYTIIDGYQYIMSHSIWFIQHESLKAESKRLLTDTNEVKSHIVSDRDNG